MSELTKIEPQNNNDRNQKEYAFNRAQKTILVVEDDRTQRTMMDKVLKFCDFQTVQAENGLVALSILDTGKQFDLVLMDWDMPELNGLETVRALREREVKYGWPHMPVIAFTSHREPGDREQCLAAGMDAYLPKDVWMPKWRDTLIDNLQGLIAGNFTLDDFREEQRIEEGKEKGYDLDAFDMQTLEQSAYLLKDELSIAVEEYLEDAAAYIKDIKEGIEKSDAEKTARGSHPLKSNSRGFGMTAVAQISEAINKASREGDLNIPRQLLPQLQKAFEKAEEKLREVVKNAGY